MRPLVLVGLIAGALPILGSCPGPDPRLQEVGRTGNITIHVDDVPASACYVVASVATPVRRFALYSGADLVREITCAGGGDCLRRLPIETLPCDAIAGAGGGSADAAAEPVPGMITCYGPGGITVQIRQTRSPRFTEPGFCDPGPAVHRLEVETAAGARSTLEFRIEPRPADDTFGCG